MSRDILAFSPRLRLATFKLGFWIAEHLPPWAGRALAYAVGTATWAFDPRGRRTVRRNLAHFIPPRCPEALGRAVRRSYIAFAMSLYESFGMRAWKPERFAAPDFEVVDPWGVYRTPPYAGAAVFTTVHCNWELGMAMCHARGLITEIGAIALSHGDEAIDALFERLRARFGCRSLLLDRAPLASLRALKDGQRLAVVAERDYTGTGMAVRFAGQTTRMPVGPAALAVQTGAPIIPSVLFRRGTSRFTLIVGRPVRAAPGAARSEEVAALTRRLAGVYARFIAAAPSQWVAFHDAWDRPSTAATRAARALDAT